MGDAGVDRYRAPVHEHSGAFHQCAAGQDLVVHDHRGFALHVTDDVEHFRHLVVARPPLLDNGQRRVERLGDVAGPFGAALVGSDDNWVLKILVDEIAADHVERRKLIDRDVEEALDLAGV